MSAGNEVVDSGLAQKVAELEQVIAEMRQQIANGVGVQAAGQRNAQPRKNVSKSSQSFKVPTGKINEVLRAATKQDIQTIREEWAGMMQTIAKITCCAS